MRRTFTSLTTLIIAVSFISAPLAVAKAPSKFLEAPSADELREKYDENGDPIRILIAPGHEPLFGGTEYQGIYEREIVIDVAHELERLLESNPKYEVVTTRSNTAWSKALDRYFDKEDDEIEDFVEDHKKLASRLERKGRFEANAAGEQVAHAAAPNDVALRLYGINKWANENDIDLILNLHVNDAPDHAPNEPSKHSGYAIYIPDSEYGNHEASEAIAEELADRLDALAPVSTLPGESAGVVEDQELIAIGAYGTLAVPSVLIEYGYITEPRFAMNVFRQTLTRDLAYQTYLGVQDFFHDPVANPRTVLKLPTTWPKPVATSTATSTPAVPATPAVPTMPGTQTTTPAVPATPAIPAMPATPAASTTPSTPANENACAVFTKTLMFDLETENDDVRRVQRILAKDPAIYPEGLITGYFGPATERAVQKFQEKNGIVSSGTPETTGYGVVGPKTAKALLERCFSI